MTSPAHPHLFIPNRSFRLDKLQTALLFTPSMRELGLAARVDDGRLPAPVLPAAERIRATVLGASEYTVQLSGITSYIPAAEATLPRRNLQVARPVYALQDRIEADPYRAAAWALGIGFVAGILVTALARRR